MADDGVVVDDDDESKIVTKFLLNTCRLLQPTEYHLQAAMYSCALAITAKRNSQHDDVLGRRCVDDEVHNIPLTTGSSAELYVQPMLSCLGDVDIMVHLSYELAIPDGYAPPTELPVEFHSRVEVSEIIDSEFPGYVFLMLSYLLTEDSDYGVYNAVRHNKRHYESSVLSWRESERHGPAMTKHGYWSQSNYMVSTDSVYCVRCLLWPPQAADWPTRHRNYGWPDSATVDRVVSNGCDVVHVAHPQCKQHKWMSRAQWRLSFSRAEIVLLNSWMPIQQIIYHMLRIFTKHERLTEISRYNRPVQGSDLHTGATVHLWRVTVHP